MRARIGLEECGLPYNLHMVDMQNGGHKKPEFTAINPNAQIPVIIDSDGPGGKKVTLSQSMAILMYCGQKSGKFLPKDPSPLYLQGLMSAASDMGPTLGAIFGITRSKEPHQPSLEPFEARWKTYLKTWDGTLAANRYCAGNEITVVDFALYGTWARAKSVVPKLCEGNPNIERWAAEIGARPATAKAMKF
jgi:GST-like protein